MFYSCRSYSHMVLLLLCVGLAQSGHAQWTGGIEGGTVIRDAGNANRVRLVLRNDARPFSQYIYAEWLGTSRSNSRNTNRNSYAVGYNPRYWIDGQNYIFGESGYRTDAALLVDRELRLLAGVGRQFINTEDQGLFAEVGVGGRSIDRILLDMSTDDTSNEGLGLVRLGYFRTLADSVKLDFNVSGSRSGGSSDDNGSDSEVSSELGVSLRIPNGSVRLAYRSRYLKRGDGESNTDSDPFISFGVGF